MKKKSICVTSCIIVLFLLMGLMGCSPAASPRKASSGEGTAAPETEGKEGAQFKIELRLAHFFPASHLVEEDLLPEWAKAIEEATNGRVTVTTYPGETLLKADETYDGVANGIAELGLSCFSYTRGRFPLLEVFELPGVVYNNSKVAGKVAWEGIKELQPQEVQDTKLMLVFATGPGNLFTKSPVHNQKDLQGMEIRATGLSAKTLEMLGAVPVAMPQSDTYEALSKGVVKGNLAPNEVLEGWRHAEVTEYLTITPFLYNTLFFLTMNLDTWNSLPPDIQSIIEDVNEKQHENKFIGSWDIICDSGLKFAVEQTGQQVISLSDDEAANWLEKIRPIHEGFIAEMEAKGLPGREALDLAKRLSDKYNEVYK